MKSDENSLAIKPRRPLWHKACLALGLALVGYVVLFRLIAPVMLYNHMYEPGTCDIYYMLRAYGRDHAGQLPTCQDVLIQAGILRRVESDATPPEVRFEYFGDYSLSWRYIHLFEDFTIAYGTDLDNLTVADDRLIDNTTHQEVLLVHGPMKYMLPAFYRKYSLQLYHDLRPQTPAD